MVGSGSEGGGHLRGAAAGGPPRRGDLAAFDRSPPVADRRRPV